MIFFFTVRHKFFNRPIREGGKEVWGEVWAVNLSLFSRFYIGGGKGKGEGEFDYGNDRIRRNEEFGFMVKFERPLNNCRVARANNN